MSEVLSWKALDPDKAHAEIVQRLADVATKGDPTKELFAKLLKCHQHVSMMDYNSKSKKTWKNSLIEAMEQDPKLVQFVSDLLANRVPTLENTSEIADKYSRTLLPTNYPWVDPKQPNKECFCVVQ
eukprot:TRINITY_DN1220_c1_g1_i1.p4 TRINITY_DN1220_c1_g1~~TRINITY_DN1220_c1_g1_i1.p4  ORF type:complete len:126 (+),score=20.07 TRINITY_DN1220_c1_g1_i1:1018-1395(+)